MLINPRKGFEGAFPLKLIPTKVSREETKFDSALVINLLNKIDYKALLYAAGTVGVKNLPAELPKQISADSHDGLLRTLHTVLLDIHVEEGTLVCPRSNREFPIKQGIPNMRLNEDEV